MFVLSCKQANDYFNQDNLKSFQNALIGWKKAGPPKKPLLF